MSAQQRVCTPIQFDYESDCSDVGPNHDQLDHGVSALVIRVEHEALPEKNLWTAWCGNATNVFGTMSSTPGSSCNDTKTPFHFAHAMQTAATKLVPSMMYTLILDDPVLHCAMEFKNRMSPANKCAAIRMWHNPAGRNINCVRLKGSSAVFSNPNTPKQTMKNMVRPSDPNEHGSISPHKAHQQPTEIAEEVTYEQTLRKLSVCSNK